LDSGLPAATSIAQNGVERGLFMTPELKVTENNPASSSDELAELLLYVWLRTEVNDNWDLPLAVVKQ
jgi:hypothetical protein